MSSNFSVDPEMHSASSQSGTGNRGGNISTPQNHLLRKALLSGKINSLDHARQGSFITTLITLTDQLLLERVSRKESKRDHMIEQLLNLRKRKALKGLKTNTVNSRYTVHLE